MDSELRAALDRASIGQHEHGYAVVSGGTQEQLQSIVDAARKVANPDYEAAAHALIDALSADLPGIGALGEIGARIAVEAALGIGGS